jgi:hypothetical protein
MCPGVKRLAYFLERMVMLSALNLLSGTIRMLYRSSDLSIRFNEMPETFKQQHVNVSKDVYLRMIIPEFNLKTADA